MAIAVIVDVYGKKEKEKIVLKIFRIMIYLKFKLI
jgi:hypothetical protein